MAVSKPKSGVTEYTISTGTGSLTLTGAAPGFRGFISTDDGLSYYYAIYQAGTAFETGIGTYNHSTRQLTRTTVLANISGTTVPLNLGSGTKEVSVVIPGERVTMIDVANTFTEDQTFNDRIYLGTGNSWMEAPSDVYKVSLNGIQVLDCSGGLGNFTLIGSNDTATAGPELTLRRDSATPAASDQLFIIRGQGRDASGILQSSFRMLNRWNAVTAGAHSSSMDIAISSAGNLQTVMTLAPSTVTIPSGVNLFTVGKTASSGTVVGAEIFADGSLSAVTNNTTPLVLARNGSDGEMIGLYRSGTLVSSVQVAGGNVTWPAFTGGHWTEWAPGKEADEQFGTVVSTAPGILDAPTKHLALVQLATAGDRNVYGIISGRRTTAFGRTQNDKRKILLIDAIGTSRIRCLGDIARGDLLRVSATPGVAEVQPDDIVRSTTVAKATQDSPDNGGERLVPCVLMAG